MSTEQKGRVRREVILDDNSVYVRSLVNIVQS